MRRYDVHGVTVGVESEDADLASAIDARLAHFRTSDGDAEVVFRYAFVDRLPARPSRGRPVYDPPLGSVRYSDEEDELVLETESVRVVCRPDEGRADVSTTRSHDRWLLSRPLFTIPLIEMLKRRGLYSVHAGAVATGGRSVLIAGSTGSGKTTLAIALARGGFDFVSDDLVFLRPRAEAVLGFPDELDVSDKTVEIFPELAEFSTREDGWSKLRVRPDALFDVRSSVSEPALILFPRIGSKTQSSLKALPVERALRELAPNVLLTERAASQAHLAAVGELAERSRCYALQTGRDFDRLAAEVAQYVSEAATS